MNQSRQVRQKPTFSGQHPVKIDSVMDGIFRSLGLSRRYYGWVVVHHWPEIVGEFIAKRTNAYRWDDGILFVAVEDPVLRQELLGNQNDIMEKIKAMPQGYVVKELRFVGSRRGNE